MWPHTGNISNGFCLPQGNGEQSNTRINQAQKKKKWHNQETVCDAWSCCPRNISTVHSKITTKSRVNIRTCHVIVYYQILHTVHDCTCYTLFFLYHYFLILTQQYVYEFLEWEERRERHREREIHRLVVSCTCPNWGWNPQPRYVPDQGSNLQPFGVWDDAPTNSATQMELKR